MKGYLIIDIGTGNVRVALVAESGTILTVERDNVIYHKDHRYQEALYFDPDHLWSQIENLVLRVLSKHADVEVLAITSSSQREGIVLLDRSGQSMVGFPNHDHRGRFLEDKIQDKDRIYELTGRYPTSLFSALKLTAYREKHSDEWEKVDCFLSISDWAQYKLTGMKRYEHAQASETILYDVEKKQWSEELLEEFGLDESLLPPLIYSGSKLGDLLPQYVNEWNLKSSVPVFVGGADTQLAVKSTRPRPGDVILVSGTTTPIVMVTSSFVLDDKQRSWTNSHLNRGQYILETNCGVTGLNYQHFKSIFYPKDTYAVIEEEIGALKSPTAFANLGSLIAEERGGVTRGGYLFEVPLMTELSRADFALATLWDIACSIKMNYDSLLNIQNSEADYVWCCGGGFQSKHLRSFVSGLLGKELKIRPGYQQASVSGAAVVCSQALDRKIGREKEIETIVPGDTSQYNKWFDRWNEVRQQLKKINKQ